MSKVGKILDGINTLLVINTFFVLGSFVWFIAALLGRGAGVPLGLDLWHQLWEPVFTPALSVLMGGAIFSGLLSQILKKFPNLAKPKQS
ncbi:MAG: hypothetical protein MH252_13125 [Thermosynechococcaceae cyanobacterium MS004]|nr:hypothetical protein [Thermosynechococcaceae cyanobacterium MS004]